MQLLNSSQTPSREQFASTFRLAGRIGFWVQLALGAVAGLSLILAILSRRTGSETSNLGIGLSIFLAVGGILLLCFRVYWAHRYTRLAKQLKADDPNPHPSKGKIIQVLRTGLFLSLVGLLLAFLASEVSIVSVLANALAQPQGVAVYNPENIIPTLDLFVVLANVNLTGAHLLGGVNSLGLLNWVTE